jgi:cytochrome c biogenesis protein CcmG, thiol:disulfide interchange protein DsbE
MNSLRAASSPLSWRAFARLLGCGLLLGWGAAAAEPVIGQPVPALVATTLGGEDFDLGKLRGDVVLVNYWATWCAPCRKDMPKLDAFYKRYQGRHLQLIGISVDRPGDLKKVRKIAAALAYPVVLQKDITTDGFGPPQGFPITWIVDPSGKVRDRMIDVRDELLDGIVLPLLPH